MHSPILTDGIEFVEFTAPDTADVSSKLIQLGFSCVGKHKHKNVDLFRQNDINFILNSERPSPASRFADVHGQSVNAIAFRVKDAARAVRQCIQRGATLVSNEVGPMELNIPAVEGVGGALIYLVDRYGDDTIYDIDFELDSSGFKSATGPLQRIDHLTHNLYRGNLERQVRFYSDIFGFRETRHFEIHGKQTGLTSRVMTSQCGKIQIPLNESADDESQIEEYLHRYHGEGVQHIALATNDIFESVSLLRSCGVVFQDTPETYFDQIDERVIGHSESVDKLRQHRVLIDGSREEGYLLQIFTEDALGPIFFELIQRKGNSNFGEGNFQALFESIERDQLRRGVLSNAT